jgi:2-polyprenyl-3-methyl-5-hydroxy-6-metoxy-1,4-benzoquinol methylase
MADQLAQTPQEFWDEKFADDDYVYGTEPNAWLVSQTYRFPEGGSVLSVADGEGRNGVWMAQQGLKVTTVDASPRALQKSMTLAKARNVSITTNCADLREWQWPKGEFDMVVSIFAHFHRDVRAGIHRNMMEALKPGGLVLLEAYSPYQLIYKTGGPPVLEMLYSAYMLQQDFTGMEILALEEVEGEIAEGRGHKGHSALTRLVARRSEAS